MNPHEGWTLRLLIDGKEAARNRVLPGKESVLTAGSGEHSITVRFQRRLFVNHCQIAAGGKTLVESSQPWNALAMTCMIGSPLLAAFVVWMLRRLNS